MADQALANSDPFNPYGRSFAQVHTESEVARARAISLLRSKLSDAQRRCYDKHGFFFVVAPSGRRYKIARGWVKYIEDGEREISLCVSSQGTMPEEDQMLAKKLHIETNEDEFLATANKSLS